MSATYAWVVILAAAAATQVLRLVPLFLMRGGADRFPRWLLRGLEDAGLATLGGLIAVVVFRTPQGTAGLPALSEGAAKLVAVAVAFVLCVRCRKVLLSLGAGYGVYLVLTLAGR
jgi:branched-subunit amino acid transport protein